MDGDAVEVVHPERTHVAGGVLRPGRVGACGVGVEHRVIDDELAASLEEVTECPRPALALEGVVLLDELPGQIAPLAAQLVAHVGELLLFRQVLLPCLEPLAVVHHLVGWHVSPPPRLSSPAIVTRRGPIQQPTWPYSDKRDCRATTHSDEAIRNKAAKIEQETT